jgi:uncharacterized membrane protein YuzA (DUF378 family)
MSYKKYAYDGSTNYYLQGGIEERQEELHRLADLLGPAADKRGRLASIAKVTTIVLGAFVATNAVATKLFGDYTPIVTIAYTLVGLIIAAVSGLDAAFKIESRASAMRALAASCQSTIFQIDSEWRKANGKPEKEEILNALLDRQDLAIQQVQARAVELGINITREVRDLYAPNQMPATA